VIWVLIVAAVWAVLFAFAGREEIADIFRRHHVRHRISVHAYIPHQHTSKDA
jgi:hypothetical protein